MDGQHYCPALAQGESQALQDLRMQQGRRHSDMVNPADCASRGLFPSELISHELWWEGPGWLKHPSSQWLDQSLIPEPSSVPDEEREICFASVVRPVESVVAVETFFSFTRLKRVTAWIMRFVSNCARKQRITSVPHLSVQELQKAESYWLSTVQ